MHYFVIQHGVPIIFLALIKKQFTETVPLGAPICLNKPILYAPFGKLSLEILNGEWSFFRIPVPDGKIFWHYQVW